MVELSRRKIQRAISSFFVMLCFCTLPAKAQYGGGTGEPNNPYLIYTAEHLNAIGAEPNDWDNHFKLMANIDLVGFSYNNALIAPGTMPNPLEFNGIAFTGVFDGRGHTISHLTINGQDCLGFFGRLGSGAEVRDIGVVDVNIVGTRSHIGGLVGSNNGAVVTRCYSSGNTMGEMYVGGLIGSIDNSSGFERGLVTNCYSTVKVTGKNGVGGLIGGSYGPVDPYFSPIPFLPDPVPVINCYSTGAVQGESTVGGLIGDNNWSGSTLIHCYSIGSISGMYHTVGGLVGYGSGDVTACFWNIETSGLTESSGGTGKTTAEMQMASTFIHAGWDFVDETVNGTDDIWWILEGEDYPRLWCQYGQAFSPYPQDDTVNVPQPLTLSWLPGGTGLYHDIFFGEDKVVVANATIESQGVYRGQQEPEMTTCNPGNLELVKTYYWRIDEVNLIDPNSPCKGDVWCFTTANFIVVDDFEDYDSDQNFIWYSWNDGLGYGPTGAWDVGNHTGSAVGDETTPSYTEETIVQGGMQSMPYWYNNNRVGYAKYSEAEKWLDYPRDWTKDGVSELSLWFHGRSDSVGSFVEEPTGVFTINSSGTDIGGERDQFHYAYKRLTGPGLIVARIKSIENTHEWAKAGLMIRQSLDEISKNAFVYVTPSNGIAFQTRAEWRQASVATNQTGITAPLWLKLERDEVGNFTASHSTNGTIWQPVQNSVPMNISMFSSVYIGLALTAHNSDAISQAVFSNVTINGTISEQWEHQDIGIVSNDVEPMYVTIANRTGTPVVIYHDDPNVVRIDTWTEWVIPLQTFADQGIDLSDVDRIAIGIGTRGNMTIPDGQGKMYFDDIRLYRPRQAMSNDL